MNSDKKADFEEQIQSLLDEWQGCNLTISEKMFQFPFGSKEDTSRIMDTFCKFFLQEVNKLGAEDLAVYLSDITLDKEDLSMNVHFKFRVTHDYLQNAD